MGQLIDDLLDFSRAGRGALRMTRIDVDQLVREAIELAQPQANDHAIDWVVSPLPTVVADETVLRLVWTNLLDNAVKYTRPHGRARIEIGCSRASAELVFWVRDDGIGFDPAYAENLFGVFQRLHPQDDFSGTGIGLATVRRVITKHGGRVWAEGSVEGGAVFYFALPQSTD